jgi:hypothetical protein
MDHHNPLNQTNSSNLVLIGALEIKNIWLCPIFSKMINSVLQLPFLGLIQRNELNTPCHDYVVVTNEDKIG